MFLEELWRYTPPQRDYLADEYKCHHFYSTRPIPAYYVVDIDHILGPSALFRCPVTPYIGPKGHPGEYENGEKIRRKRLGQSRVLVE